VVTWLIAGIELSWLLRDFAANVAYFRAQLSGELKRLKRQRRERPCDALNIQQLVIDEFADIFAFININLHHQVKITTGGIKL